MKLCAYAVFNGSLIAAIIAGVIPGTVCIASGVPALRAARRVGKEADGKPADAAAGPTREGMLVFSRLVSIVW